MSTEEKPSLEEKAERLTPSWKDGSETGAFMSRTASFRFETQPTPWYVAARDITAIYLTFVGIPVGAAVWAGYLIGASLGWWS